MASPTLRSSSSTVPGPSWSNSPTSMRARPSTAETCTGTSNIASRSAAPRVVAPSVSGASGISAGASPPSRFGSGTLLSSVMLGSPENVVRARKILARADVAVHCVADRRIDFGTVAVDPAVGPFDAAVADPDLRLGEHHEATLEAAGAGDIVELF